MLHGIFKLSMVALTIYALVANDFRVGFFEDDGVNIYFDIGLIICLAGFAGDIACRMVAEPMCVLGFHLGADVVSAFLLIADISSVPPPVLPIGLVVVLNIGRALRVVRFVRLIHESSIYCRCLEHLVHHPIPSDTKDPMGRQLCSASSSMMGILLALCWGSSPLVASTTTGPPGAGDYAVRSISRAFASGDRIYYSQSLSSVMLSLTNQTDALSQLGWIGYDGPDDPSFLMDDPLHGLDPLLQDQLTIFPAACPGFGRRIASLIPPFKCPPLDKALRVFKSPDAQFSLIFTDEAVIEWDAFFNLFKTALAVLLLLIADVRFEMECNRVFLHPMGMLVSTMRAIQANPFRANALVESNLKEFLDYRAAIRVWAVTPWWKRLFKRPPPVLVRNEFRLYACRDSITLEKTIVKIRSLLLVGFGEAGSEIVGASIADGTHTSRRPGRKVDAIFGYVSILDFNTTTEVLEDRIVVLVNQVAEIVHGIVEEFNGFVSKNYGSGFLLVWRIDDEDKRQRMAELAITALVEILAAVARSPVLATYRDHPHLKQRIPHYKVRLGMALHAGHGIEGAVGSDFKLDASFLGEDVVLSQRLESLATHVYGCCIVLSDGVVKMISEAMKADLCRRIDTVSIGGPSSSLTIQLFTIDLDFSELKTQVLTTEVVQRFTKEVRKAQKLDMLKYSPLAQFQVDELAALRRKFKTKTGAVFFQIFHKGFANYECGEWEVAKKALRHSLVYWDLNGRDRSSAELAALSDFELLEIQTKEKNMDGPSLALIKHMLTHTEAAWKGYRSI